MTEPTGPSWDTERQGAPPRPSVHSSLPPEDRVPRPQRVVVAVWLVLAATVVFVLLTVLAGLRLDEVREAVTTSIPDDLSEDYSATQIRRAVWVLIAAAGGLGLLLTLGQLLSIRSVAARRSQVGRVVFVAMVVLSLPVALLSASVRSGGRGDEALSLLVAVCLLVAAVLICLRPVSVWLRQTERRERIPLLPGEQEPDDQGETTSAGHDRRLT